MQDSNGSLREHVTQNTCNPLIGAAYVETCYEDGAHSPDSGACGLRLCDPPSDRPSLPHWRGGDSRVLFGRRMPPYPHTRTGWPRP